MSSADYSASEPRWPGGAVVFNADYQPALTLLSNSCSVEVTIMINLNIKHNELTAEEFILLWESVWGNGPSPEQTQLAMDHTLFRVSVFDGDTIIAMARVIGDLGLDYYIKDVVVRPEYQGQGIGRLMINEILKFINDHGVPGTDIFVELCAMPDKIPFYEKFGFSANEAQRLRKYLRVTGSERRQQRQESERDVL